MHRKLSTIDITGTLFEVDAQREMLRQKDNPKNGIPFHAFDQERDGYRFLYDIENRGIPANRKAVMENPERYRWVTIPALMELDPEGIALRYGIPLEILLPDDNAAIPKHLVAEVRPLITKQKVKIEQNG